MGPTPGLPSLSPVPPPSADPPPPRLPSPLPLRPSLLFPAALAGLAGSAGGPPPRHTAPTAAAGVLRALGRSGDPRLGPSTSRPHPGRRLAEESGKSSPRGAPPSPPGCRQDREGWGRLRRADACPRPRHPPSPCSDQPLPTGKQEVAQGLHHPLLPEHGPLQLPHPVPQFPPP